VYNGFMGILILKHLISYLFKIIGTDCKFELLGFI